MCSVSQKRMTFKRFRIVVKNIFGDHHALCYVADSEETANGKDRGSGHNKPLESKQNVLRMLAYVRPILGTDHKL